MIVAQALGFTAENLAKVLRGFSNHLNLIRLNPVKERSFRATKNDKAQEFLKTVKKVLLRFQVHNDSCVKCKIVSYSLFS